MEKLKLMIGILGKLCSRLGMRKYIMEKKGALGAVMKLIKDLYNEQRRKRRKKKIDNSRNDNQ